MPRRSTGPTYHNAIYDLKEFGLPEVPLLGIHHQLRAWEGLTPHIHEGAMEICYQVKGEVVFSVAGRDYALKGNDVFWTRPNETHGSGVNAYDKGVLYWTQIRLPERPGTFLGLSASVAWPLVQELRRLRIRKFRGHWRLRGLFEEAFHLCSQPPSPMQRLGLATNLAEWLRRIVECAHRGSAPAISPDIRKALDLIPRRLTEPIAMAELAAEAGLSESRLKAKFREQVGIPPGEYVMRQRIQQARQRLEAGKATVTDVAYQFGFSSSQYFANVFRRFTNSRPSDVRGWQPGRQRS